MGDVGVEWGSIGSDVTTKKKVGDFRANLAT